MKSSNQLCSCWPWWLYVYNLFPWFKMWYILTSSKYTWSWKHIPEFEWDTQVETQPLESPHRVAHICCQIPSLSPGLSYDQQCYQWPPLAHGLQLVIYLFVVLNFDALAQASDIRSKGDKRQVVFLCWMQDSNLGSQTSTMQPLKFGNGQKFHLTPYDSCNCFSMLGFKSIQVSIGGAYGLHPGLWKN